MKIGVHFQFAWKCWVVHRALYTKPFEGLGLLIRQQYNSNWMASLHGEITNLSAPVEAWDVSCACLRVFRKALQKTSEQTFLTSELGTAKASTLYELINARRTPMSAARNIFCGHGTWLIGEPKCRPRNRKVCGVRHLEDIATVFDKHVGRLCQAQRRISWWSAAKVLY